MQKVLLVEDDPSVSSSVRQVLGADDFRVDIASTLSEANAFLDAFNYDLLILDWELPDGSGVDLCKKLRGKGFSAPILVLTGRSSIDHKEQGFNSGADDYLTKPFHPRELTARVYALLRRSPALVTNKLQISDLEFELRSRTVTRAGQNVDLQPHEMSVLEFLMRNAGTVYSTDQLLRRCWESDAEISPDAVYTCIGRLRRKICPAGEKSLITTVHGQGYRMEPD